MAILKIRYYGDPVLRKKAEKVIEFDSNLEKTVKDMLETMYANNGIGLAANQVGILKQIIVIDTGTKEKPDIKILINPEIKTRSKEKTEYEEGCLSFPGLTEKIQRPAKIAVKCQDIKGNFCEFDAEGLLSIAIQHEYDHINGILFIDKMSPVKRFTHNKKLREIKNLSKEKK